MDIYDRYVRYNELTWQRPCYIKPSQPPYVPTEEEVSILISASPKKYALIFSILRDTGMRPIELERMRLRWIDFERGAINVQTAESGIGRTLQLKPQTLAMLKEYVGKRKLGLSDKLFATVACMRARFAQLEKIIASKLQHPELLRINLYSLHACKRQNQKVVGSFIGFLVILFLLIHFRFNSLLSIQIVSFKNLFLKG